jgi:hypothetical protein
MLRIIMTFVEQRLGSLITVTPIGILCPTVSRVLEIWSNFCCGSGFLPYVHGRRGGCEAWPRGEGEEQGVHSNMPLRSIEKLRKLRAKQLQNRR